MGGIAKCPPGGPGGEVSLLPFEAKSETQALLSFHLEYPSAPNDALCTDGTTYYVRLDRLKPSTASPSGSGLSPNASKADLIWLIQRKQDAVVGFLSQVSQDRLDLSTALEAKARLDEKEKSSSGFGRAMTGLGAYLGGVSFAWGAFGVGSPALTDLSANMEFQKLLRQKNLCMNPDGMRNGMKDPQPAGSFFKRPSVVAHAVLATAYAGYSIYNMLSGNSPKAVELAKSPVSLDDEKHYSATELEKMTVPELQEVSRKLNGTIDRIGLVRRELAEKRIPIQDQLTQFQLAGLAEDKSIFQKLMPHLPEVVVGGTAGTLIGFGPFNHQWQRFYQTTAFHQRAALAESSLEELVKSGLLVSCRPDPVTTSQSAFEKPEDSSKATRDMAVTATAVVAAGVTAKTLTTAGVGTQIVNGLSQFFRGAASVGSAARAFTVPIIFIKPPCQKDMPLSWCTPSADDGA